MVEKLVPDPFIKIKILAYLWIDSIKCYKVCFYCMFKSRSTAFPLYKTFFIKNKASVELVPLRHFLADFWREIFLMLCFIHFTSRDTSDMCIIIICCPVCDVINFENNHSFPIKPFLYTTKKSGQKYKYLKNEKSFKHERKSIFHHF